VTAKHMLFLPNVRDDESVQLHVYRLLTFLSATLSSGRDAFGQPPRPAPAAQLHQT
jgi:hypothetical protein